MNRYGPGNRTGCGELCCSIRPAVKTELKSSEKLDRSRGNSQRKNQAERSPTEHRKPLKSAAEENRENSGEAGNEFQAKENSCEASNPRERGSDPRLKESATSFVMPGT